MAMAIAMTRLCRRLFSQAVPGYSKLPLQEHYMQLLVKEGFEEDQAKELISILDGQIRQRLAMKSTKYLAGRDYFQLIKKYEDSINSFRQTIFTNQQDLMQSIHQDYTGLDQEIGQTQHSLLNDTKQLESGIQLDLNMEVKRRHEAREEIVKKAESIAAYADEQLETIQADLTTVSKQARSAIIAFGSVAFVSLVIYHASAT